MPQPKSVAKPTRAKKPAKPKVRLLKYNVQPVMLVEEGDDLRELVLEATSVAPQDMDTFLAHVRGPMADEVAARVAAQAAPPA